MVTTDTVSEPFAIFHPTSDCKIGRLCHVEPMIEARVVGMRKDNDHRARLMNNLLHTNSICFEELWSNHDCLVPQQVEAGGGKVREKLLSHLLQLIAKLWRNTVPGLWGSPMDIVDTVQVHVLNMPAEGGLPHAKVEVGQVDPRDLLLHHLGEKRVQSFDVPSLLVFVCQGIAHISSIARGHGLVVEVLLPVELL